MQNLFVCVCVRAHTRIFSQSFLAGIDHIHVIQNISDTKKLY